MFIKDILTDIVVPIIIAIIASSGFWMAMAKRYEQRGLQTKLLIGLAHDRIVWLGVYYIKRGYIEQDEYENLHDYLWKSYEELGGNGTAKKVMDEVDKLPMLNKSAPLQRNTLSEGEMRNGIQQ